MQRIMILLVSTGLFAAAAVAAEESGEQLGDLAKMPIEEVTVFKDGHAFVLHAGQMPTDADGNVVMDYLPTPILGTFWPFADDPNAKLAAVVAGTREIRTDSDATDMAKMLQANVDKKVIITDNQNRTYEARLLAVHGTSLVLLETHEGVRAMPFGLVREVVFPDSPATKIQSTGQRNILTMKLAWPDTPAEQAEVGMVYLQKGLRWIPNYKIVLDGEGTASVQLQATLINEMIDLTDVTAHLVIGVPSFEFAHTIDPIALQAQAAQLSQYFQRSARRPRATMLVAQQARSLESRGDASGAGGGTGPELSGAERAEDLFVFDIEHLTLAKGERMVLPVVEFTIPYQDVFTLEIPIAPPAETWGEINRRFWRESNRREVIEVARLMSAPKAIHKIRLTNESEYPFTTAPAMIYLGEKVLAQGMLTYTSIGGKSDLAVTTAIDIKVKKSETETARDLKALVINGTHYSRVDMAGTLELTNYRDTAVAVEVKRYVLGNVGQADHDGQSEMINALENPDFLPTSMFSDRSWWRWYDWPSWWYRHNGVGRFTWKLQLEPGESIELGYTWHYFWR